MNWICLVFGIFIAAYSLSEYYFGQVASFSWFHLFQGVVFFLLGYININEEPPAYPDIILNKEGIKYSDEEKDRTMKWSQIKSVHVTNNKLVLHFEHENSEELSINYLEFKELQTVKEKLKTAAQTHNIGYNSKY